MTANAQQSGNHDAALAVEIQALRRTIEQSAAVDALVGLISRRAALAQQRIDSLRNEERDLRGRVASAVSDQARAESVIRSLQAQNPTPDSLQFKSWDDALRAARSDAERAAAALEQYRNWQAELTDARREEETKLNRLNARLDKLEGSLEAAAAEEKRP